MSARANKFVTSPLVCVLFIMATSDLIITFMLYMAPLSQVNLSPVMARFSARFEVSGGLNRECAKK